MAEVIVKKNINLPAVRGSKGLTTVHMAALLGHRDMVLFLCSVTRVEDLTKEDFIGLLVATIGSDLYGFKVVHDKKLLDMQSLELVKRLWGQILLLDDAQIGNILKSPSRPLFVAAELGNFEFVFELLHSYPDLIWKVDEQSRSIFHIAVINRQEKIFTLIYDIGAHKDLITDYQDSNNTNMLHLAGKLAPLNRLNIVSGAALQMQWELLWFKEVEKNVQPSYKEMRDMEGRTPRMLFTEEHKGLVKAGERSMKDTASSCMFVAALITTVMFAVIFTVPGGNNNIGIPNFLLAKTFMLFAISDAFSLFSSVTAILMFLTILTSRYAEKDFLESLPKRLIIGLTTLFFSIASELVAFSAIN
ncbi:Ankyrin repeat-containing protein ITN1 [Camellia lanceoleosa]|uniref:Ankyrin repeat-containing protein ITN1 n=1 Tax=Camellia lanceoleosa TaxID=1840588 RepID=A0ACC0GGY9_9ERIC|nr:Ankyrin repeat-containing protein ITN1 [Camellia lanceoleosa]